MNAVVATPLRTEHLAVRRGVRAARVERSGRGLRRSAAWVSARPAGPVLVAGVAGALQPGLRPGDLVVADEVTDGTVRVTSDVAPLLAGALRRRGLPVHVGALFTSDRVATGAARQRLAVSGALAVDTETLSLAAGGGPFAAIRAVVDTPSDPLFSPATVTRGLAALRALKAAGPVIDEWTAALGAREVLLATDQQAVRALAASTDLVLVVGSANSSNPVRLVEVAERAGVPAHLVEDAGQVDLRRLAGTTRVGVTAGASAPPHLVDDLVRALSGLGPVSVREEPVTAENVFFHPPATPGPLPQEVS